jgi:hypothetical protein
MSTDANLAQQQMKQKEFMQLLPLITLLAGLPTAEHGKHLTPDQMEVRAMTIKAAYKVARNLVLEIAK